MTSLNKPTLFNWLKKLDYESFKSYCDRSDMPETYWFKFMECLNKEGLSAMVRLRSSEQTNLNKCYASIIG